MKNFSLIGAAIDACAGTKGSADTPAILNKQLSSTMNLKFSQIHRYVDGRHDLNKLATYFTKLGNSVQSALEKSRLPVVIGGDHSCAIGTWSGVANFLGDEDFGLIWMDAHMDAHTPENTISGNIHGMPVATLLGYGYPEFKNLMQAKPKLKPENIILIGIRSYEGSELELLQRLGVKVYYNYDVEKHGFAKLFEESWQALSGRVSKIGLSIDLDGFDPEFAPGVGTLEPDGINFNHFINTFAKLDPQKLVAVEITEGNDHFDPSGKTLQCIINILKNITNLI